MMNRFKPFMQSAMGRRRGMTLLWVTILLPVLALLFMAILSRIEVAMTESQRNQDRAQARLLAESGLLLAREALREKGAAALGGALPAGKIEGQGTYQVVAGEAAAGGRRVLARGAVTRHQLRFVCEIGAELEATTQTLAAPLRVNEIRYRVEPL